VAEALNLKRVLESRKGIEMKLWLIEQSAQVDWDEAVGFVIRAESEVEARKMASKEAGDEGAVTWLDIAHSNCVELNSKGEGAIILRAFKAG
jgi:hypothetical protein